MGELKIDGLRGWLAEVKKIGEVAEITKEVDTVLEMSSIAYLNGRIAGQPTLHYLKPKGFDEDAGTVLFNPIGGSFNRLALAFRAKPGRRPLELVQYIKNNFNKLSPEYIDAKDAPIFENQLTGDKIDLFKFPIPQHWPRDGGKYIGTGDVIITQDPDSGRYNVGTYRQMAMEKDKVGFFTSPGKGGGLDREKWWARGKPMPVVSVYGVDPLLMVVGSTGFGNHESEFDYAGGFAGTPVKLIKGRVTGLPIPADCEFAVEGYVYPDRTLPEGPFGEFTGYYGKPGANCPYVQIEAIYHRNKPIHTAAMMADKPGACEQAVFLATMRSAKIWRDMEAAGVAGIKGVWSVPAGAGGWGMTVISIKQMFAGHAQQAAMVAAGSAGGGFYSKFYYIVDDDIDPTDLEEVMWAATTRCRCSEDIEIWRNTWSTPLDPSKNPPEERAYGSKAFIFACKQHKYINVFSKRTAMTQKSYDNAAARWQELGLPGEPPKLSFVDDLK